MDEVAQRNPQIFELPVAFSISGTVARTTENEIYLVSGGVKIRYDLKMNKRNNIDYSLISSAEHLIRIYMVDDTKNRVLTADKVIIKGVYRHSAKTLSDCTYELVE